MPSTAGALYYPYIHFHDLKWLKANLLLFPCVRRMVPMEFTPLDSDGVKELTFPHGGKPPLVQPAHLWAERPQTAQDDLAERLSRDSEDDAFMAAYGSQAVQKMAGERSAGFQIHARKLSNKLQEVLRPDGKLAWPPFFPEPYQSQEEYIEVHPRIGEAVMSTIAVASAQASGLDIVGDQRSGPLHRCLLEKDLSAIYDAWLKPSDELEAPQAASSRELFEFVVGFPGQIGDLTVEQLYELAEEREPIDDLLNALRQQAARIPAMDDGPDREAAFKQAAAQVLEKWQADRRNLSAFGKEFFGWGSADLATGFASHVADKMYSVSSGIAGGWLGTLAAGGVIGAGAGVVVGLLVHAGRSYHKIDQREKTSPYRFFTRLEKAGVLFQSDAVDAQPSAGE